MIGEYLEVCRELKITRSPYTCRLHQEGRELVVIVGYMTYVPHELTAILEKLIGCEGDHNKDMQ